MIKQPISIVDCVDNFGNSTNSFPEHCFEPLDSVSHLKTFSLNGTIGQHDFEFALLVYFEKDKSWRLFSQFARLKEYCDSLTNNETVSPQHQKIISEENVKELCAAQDFKSLQDLCSAAPYVVVQLQNIYQNNSVGIPGIIDLSIDSEMAKLSTAEQVENPKKRKAELEPNVAKKSRLSTDDKIDSSEDTEEEKKNELTLNDVLPVSEQNLQEPLFNLAEPPVEERQSFGVIVTIYAHNESIAKLFAEQKKVASIRELTFVKFRRSQLGQGTGKSANYAELFRAAKAFQAIADISDKKKKINSDQKSASIFQPPLVEQCHLFPQLTTEHGFRFPLFDYQRRFLYWMLQRERQTLLFSAWHATVLDETTTGNLDQVAIPARIQVASGDVCSSQFFLTDGLITLSFKRGTPRIRFSQRTDETLSKFCDKVCPDILKNAHYPYRVQQLCRTLFGTEASGIVSDEFLADGLDGHAIPEMFIDDEDSDDPIEISDSSGSVSIVDNTKKIKLNSSITANLLSQEAHCTLGPSSECHGECKEVQDVRSRDTVNLGFGTEKCPLPIIVEAFLRSAQASSMVARQNDAKISTRRIHAGNPSLFPCGVCCGRTGCGKTTMCIALLYVSKLWEDAQPENLRESYRGANNFEALLPVHRRPLKMSENFLTIAQRNSRKNLYYANCTLVVCPEQVVEQWFMEFVKTIGCGVPKKRPESGKSRAVMNGGVYGEIVDENGKILLHIAVVRDVNGLKQLNTADIINKMDVVIVNQSLFRSESYRDNQKKTQISQAFKTSRGYEIGQRLFEDPNDHDWIANAVSFEREQMVAAETKLEASMLDADQKNYDFDSIPKPGFSMGRTLLHAHHWRRIIIDEAHLLSAHITPVERGVAALTGDFTWLVTATANFQSRGAFRRHSKRNEGGYGVLLHLKSSDDRTYLEGNADYRGQFVQQCSATTSYEALPQLFLHRVNVQMTQEEIAIYSSLRNGQKYRMLRLLFCSHHMLNDQAWVQKNLITDEFSEVKPGQANAQGQQNNVVTKLMTVAEVAASLQATRQAEIEKANGQIISFNQNFVQLWLKLTTDEDCNKEALAEAQKIVEQEISEELELAQNEPSNIKGEVPELTVDFLGTITDPMLELWQTKPDVRIAMTYGRVDDEVSRRAISLRARYTTNCTNNRLPILRQRERTLAEFDFFRRIFQRLSQPDEEIECPVCLEDKHTKKAVVLTVCGHEFCTECAKLLFKTKPQCVVCRRELRVPRDLRLVDRITVAPPPPPPEKKEVSIAAENALSILETYGSKLAALITLIQKILKRRDCKKIIVFAQFQRLLVLIAGVLEKSGVNFVVAKGSIRQCEKAFRAFHFDNNVRLILLSSEKSISGVHLVEANHMIAVHPTMCSRGVDEEVATFMQAVARMRRLMQQNDCHVWQLVTSNTIEEQQYHAQTTALRAKYAMDVGIHWNAPHEENSGDTNAVTTEKTEADKSREEVMRLFNGADIAVEGDVVEPSVSNAAGEQVENDEMQEDEDETPSTELEENNDEENIQERLSLSDWLSKKNYRK